MSFVKHINSEFSHAPQIFWVSCVEAVLDWPRGRLCLTRTEPQYTQHKMNNSEIKDKFFNLKL
jgi:hypothetical protein